MYLLCWRFQVEELQKQNYLSCEELQQVEFIQTIENLCSTPATRCSIRLDTSRRVLLSFLLQMLFLVYLPLLLMQQYSKWCLEESWLGLGDVASWIRTLVWARGHIFRWMRGVCGIFSPGFFRWAGLILRAGDCCRRSRRNRTRPPAGLCWILCVWTGSDTGTETRRAPSFCPDCSRPVSSSQLNTRVNYSQILRFFSISVFFWIMQFIMQ